MTTSQHPSTSTPPEPRPDPQAGVPRHVAIIMDGNGRWASARSQPRIAGHRAGTGNVRAVITRLVERGVKYATLFAFSTENWTRPDDEVVALLGLLAEVIKSEAQELHENNVRILHIGRLDRLPPDLCDEILSATTLTQDNKGLTLTVAFDYGGRDDIVSAVRHIVADGIPAAQIDEATVARHLSTASIPDPDLVVRTGGEMRISNFLLWQSAYAEFYSTPVNWPDFDAGELDLALEAYRHRQRRFGGTGQRA